MILHQLRNRGVAVVVGFPHRSAPRVDRRVALGARRSRHHVRRVQSSAIKGKREFRKYTHVLRENHVGELNLPS